jgi:hypothetical protein
MAEFIEQQIKKGYVLLILKKQEQGSLPLNRRQDIAINKQLLMFLTKRLLTAKLLKPCACFCLLVPVSMEHYGGTWQGISGYECDP